MKNFPTSFVATLLFFACIVVYASVLFCVSQVHFLHITMPTFETSLYFSLILFTLPLLIGLLLGAVYSGLKVKKFPLLFKILISFLSPFIYWSITDWFFSEIHIPMWIIAVYSLIIAILNFCNFNELEENEEESKGLEEKQNQNQNEIETEEESKRKEQVVEKEARNDEGNNSKEK
ncbi:hypothetical protein SFC65_24325 [Priestia filamentosa]|uniref:hypothetical protein n=1 Tax=Priestia filamentosa TaxID=1402861 RepID=UPI003982935E